MTNAVQINGAGYTLPPGLTIPVKNIDPGQTEVKFSISTEKMVEGTYSFIVNGDGQVPSTRTKGRTSAASIPATPSASPWIPSPAKMPP
jgi:hypothetical protein